VIYLNNSADFEAFTQDSAELVQQLAVPLGLAIQTLELRKSESLVVDKSTRVIAEIGEMAVPHLAGRGKRVAAMANVMGKVMGLKRPQLLNLQVACLLHHVGYSEWSKKPDLSFEFLRDDLSYVERSVELLKRNDAYNEVKAVVATHRYRLDGKGTPAKLDPSTWSAEAQIISLCVELDIRLNLPMAFGREAQSIGEVAEFVSKEGTTLVTRPIVTIFEKAWKKGLIIA
jgi:HD-GYP domain-containing protein (c-di-GMP phosphodiesterase class II)